MRRRYGPAWLPLVLSLLLAACGSSGGPAGPFPTASGAFGERPELVFPDESPSAELETAVLHEGDGAVVEAGDLLVAHYLGQVWGGAIFDNSYDRGAVSSFPIGTGRIMAGWDTGLVGQTVGSRVLLVIPPEQGYGPQGNESAGISGTDTIAFVVDIVGTYGAQAAGDASAAVTDEAAAIGPVVDGEPGSPAAISLPDGLAEPAEVTATVLARSDGDPVVPGDIVIQYAASFWDNSDGESTWELGRPRMVAAGSGGAFDRLVGVPVGSRVVLELPQNEGLPAVALVVDILAQSNVD